MPFAVVQSDLTPPPVERLKRAFQHVRGLTAADAFILGSDAYGVLVKNFTADQAVALQGALRTEGIETEVVDQDALPQLPPAKQVTRMDCLPQHLLLYDPLGRSFSLPWPHVSLVAAGWVQLTEFVREANERPLLHYTGAGPVQVGVETDYTSREQRSLRPIGEIFITGNVLRYAFSADKFNFQYLGERRTADAADNFVMLVRDLAGHTAKGTLSRGAEIIGRGERAVYPSRNAFCEEIVWTLWQRQKSQ